MHPGLLARILSEADLKRRDLPPHLLNMVATAWSLGAFPSSVPRAPTTCPSPRLFGHFLTKSRGYSTTFGALRDARAHGTEKERSKARAREDDQATEGSRPWMGQRGRSTLRRRPSPPAG